MKRFIAVVALLLVLAGIKDVYASAAKPGAFWGNKYQTCINDANYTCIKEHGGYNKEVYDVCYAPKEAVCTEKYPEAKKKLLGL